MAVKSKPKAKAKAKVVAKAKPKTKVKKAVAKSKAKTVVKAKPVAKAKPKTKVNTKSNVKAKKAVAKAKAAPKAATPLKAKTKLKIAAKAVTKAKPEVSAKSSGKLKNSVVKPEAPAAKAKAAPKPKVKLDVQKTTYHPISGSGGPIDFVPYREQKNEDYMNPQQAEHFRKILRGWLAQLREEVDNTMAHMQEEMGTYPDPVDRAAQEEEFSLELRARDRERKLIKKIEQAIDDIDHNDYGYCKDCGAEIGIRRLEARPTADKCIDCKTFEEIKEKQIGA